MSATPTTFREAYALLQRHAQSLRAEQEPDIDNLTTIVRESLEAYRVCKARIDAVERALEASLGEAATAGTLPGDPRDASNRTAPADEPEDDDISF